MKRYLEYKKTNISWFGEIPKDWRIERVKRHFSFSKDSADPEGKNVLSLTMKGIKIRDVSTNEGQLPESFNGYRYLKRRDIVFNPMDLVSGYVDLAEIEGIISPAYSVLRKRDFSTVNLKYITLQFQRNYKEKIFWWYGQGVSFDHRWELKDKVLMNFPILLPTEIDQERIVSEIRKVEDLINAFETAKLRYISLLKSYKQSKIDELVTKGLNPNIKMKHSSIEWLGMIPEHWNVRRLKTIVTKPLQYGANESGSNVPTNSLRYIRITDFSNDNTLSEEDKLYLSFEKGMNYKLNKNDLLLARSGATAGKVFICSNLTEESCFAGYLIRAVVNQEIILPQYLYHYMHSNAYNNWISYTFIKSTIENISATKYENLSVSIPTLHEQDEILKKIDEIEIEHRKMITMAEKQIELILEYRRSLIYELITGKRKP